MSRATDGDTVRVDYVGRLDDGSVFDTSEGRDPLAFTLGTSSVIPGFERTVTGMEVGETRTARLPPDEAYGERRDDLELRVPRERFPEEIDPEVGQQLQMTRPSGPPALVTVTAVDEEAVTLDANHPLAGEALTFEITLVGID